MSPTHSFSVAVAQKVGIREAVFNPKSMEAGFYKVGRLDPMRCFSGQNCDLRQYRVESGVYLIDNVYVGTSTNVRKRIVKHILDAVQGRHPNKALQNHIQQMIAKGQKLSVSIISSKVGDEARVYNELQAKGLPLLNSPQGRLLNQSCCTQQSTIR